MDNNFELKGSKVSIKCIFVNLYWPELCNNNVCFPIHIFILNDFDMMPSILMKTHMKEGKNLQVCLLAYV